MSFKVYNAYKVVNPHTIWDITKLIQTQGELNAKQALRKHYIDQVRQMDPDTEDYKKARKNYDRVYDVSETNFRLWHAQNLLREGYKESPTRIYRSPYNLDTSIAVYPHKGQYYIRTFCDGASITGMSLDFVKGLPGLVDFHYQNSADKPEEISNKEWKHRETVWNEIVEPFHDIGHQLIVEIVCWTSYWRVDPASELLSEWRKKPLKLPSREEVWAEALRKLAAFKKVTARKGSIRAMPGNVSVTAKDGRWVAAFAGKTLKFRTLNQAADRVYFEHLPESTRDMINRYRQSQKEKGKTK